MSDKFTGTYEQLKEKVEATGIQGQWDDLGNQKVFKANNRARLNWWQSKGTINFQGDPEASLQLQKLFNKDGCIGDVKLGQGGAKIFIVHGHDSVALEQLELVLRRLGLDPYILQNNDGQSRTLIEALEQQIYEGSAFGIVLMTPDDYGYSKSQTDADRQPRSRQNVILEMGMVIASLGRSRMVILKKGNLEMPSDVNGIIYLEFNEHVKEIALKLAQRIKSAGIDIDDSKITVAST